MEVHVECSLTTGIPAFGAHELSWDFMLDHVLADAYHAGLARLTVIVPTEALAEAVRLRAYLVRAACRAPDAGNGLACLPSRGGDEASVDRFYQLRFGSLAPRRLRALTGAPPTGMRRIANRAVYTWTAYSVGPLIRGAHTLGRPDLQDRLLAWMRRRFTASGAVPAYYHLTTFAKVGERDPGHRPGKAAT